MPNIMEDEEDLGLDIIHESSRNVILYFYGAYGLFYIIGLTYRLFLPEIKIPFILAESGKKVFYSMELSEILDIIFIGIAFTITSFYAFNWLLVMLPQGTDIKTKRNYNLIFIIAILLTNYGVMTHMVTNQLNNIVSNMIEAGQIVSFNSELDQLTLGIYLWDEIISHMLGSTGFFLIGLLFIRMEQNSKVREKFNTRNDVLTYSLSFIIGMFASFFAIEGQVGTIFFIISMMMLIYIIKLFKMTDGLTKPFTFASMWFLIGFILFTII